MTDEKTKRTKSISKNHKTMKALLFTACCILLALFAVATVVAVLEYLVSRDQKFDPYGYDE